jgi:hypothetical protein
LWREIVGKKCGVILFDCIVGLLDLCFYVEADIFPILFSLFCCSHCIVGKRWIADKDRSSTLSLYRSSKISSMIIAKCWYFFGVIHDRSVAKINKKIHSNICHVFLHGS